MYTKMLRFVKEYLENSGGEITKFSPVAFRKRSEHCRRVFMWAQRIADGIDNINKEAVLTAAVFHDVGYGDALDRSKHAENSAVICEEYLKENGYDSEFIDFVTYLVRNHSSKELMTKADTPLELILLMEADLLDETGALSIVWDCMMEGSEEVQSFEKSLRHIIKFSVKSIEKNLMITDKAKAFWENKQRLTEEFAQQLQFDLGIEQIKQEDIIMNVKLVRPTKEMEQQYYDFVSEWKIHGEDIVPYAARLLDMDYDTWLENTYKYESRETCPSTWVPAHTYFLVDEDNKILGAVNIRHTLNEYLLSFGGHIGYGIRPSQRRKGYAVKMLELALPMAKNLGIERALITCDKENVGSAKTIIANGGILENEVPEEGRITQRYWIQL